MVFQFFTVAEDFWIIFPQFFVIARPKFYRPKWSETKYDWSSWDSQYIFIMFVFNSVIT